MKRQGFLALAAAATLVACEGFKEAMTAHVDVVAKAGGQELSVTRLAELLGNSQVPLQKEVARAVADLWVNYQLLGVAAAKNDSLNAPKVVDSAMWSAIASAKSRKFGEQVLQSLVKVDTAANAARYAQGEILAARHILIMVPQEGISDGNRAGFRKTADSVRAVVTPANFSQVASRVSQDPGSKERGGDLGFFPRGQMVPEFEKAVVALKPGEVSPVIQSQFGFHVIYRPTYDEVKKDFAGVADEQSKAVAESTYLAGLEKGANIQVKANAPALVRAIAKDVDGHKDDRTVIATTARGDFTAAKVARWITAFPPQARQQIQSAPDSVLPMFVKQVIRNELIIRQADSAKVSLDTAELNGIRRSFAGVITNSWTQLGIDPRSLGDSAKSRAERERLAATRVEDFIDRLVQQKAPFVEVPAPVQAALRDQYDTRINDAGLDRALERAQKIRATADSTRAANQAPTQVPMPGQPGAPGQARPQGAPQGAPAPQGKAPAPGTRP